MYRKIGTKSHECLYWENISCQDETILKSIEENQNEYFLKDFDL